MLHMYILEPVNCVLELSRDLNVQTIKLADVDRDKTGNKTFFSKHNVATYTLQNPINRCGVGYICFSFYI